MSLRPWELDPLQQRIRRIRIVRRRAEREYPKGDAGIMALMIGLIGWAVVIVFISMMRVSGYIEVKETVKPLAAPQVIPAPPTDFETDTTIEYDD